MRSRLTLIGLIRTHFQLKVWVATETLAVEQLPLWKEKAAFSKETTGEDQLLLINAQWLHGDEATEYLPFNMVGGVRHHVQLTGRIVNMEDPTDAEMEKEDLGQTMCTS